MNLTIAEKQFAKKLLREFGIDYPVYPITHEEIITALKYHLGSGVSQGEIEAERRATRIARNLLVGEILIALGLSLDYQELTDEEIVAFIKKNFVDKTVDDAMLRGKLYPHERDWALGFAAREPEVFRAFVAARKKIVKPISDRRQISGESGKIDALQDSINKQVNVSTEMFLKYNPSGRRPAEIGEIQTSINEQLGVSDALFLKHSSPSR